MLPRPHEHIHRHSIGASDALWKASCDAVWCVCRVQAAVQLAGAGPMARRLGRLLSSRPDLNLQVQPVLNGHATTAAAAS